MSETTTRTREPGDGQRRRSRGGRRRRNRNNSQNQGNRNQGNRNQGGRNQGNRGGRDQGRQRSRAPRPKPLTWWQKILKAIGLYKPETQSRGKPATKTKPKSNTRVAGAVAGARTEEPKERSTPQVPKPDPKTIESPRLYVGNLSYDATEPDLEELFKGFGSVRAVEIVYNRRTHRSKGYAFVSMHHVDDARRAVEVLHDQPFMGRQLIVNGAVSDGPSDGDDESDDSDDSDDSGREE